LQHLDDIQRFFCSGNMPKLHDVELYDVSSTLCEASLTLEGRIERRLIAYTKQRLPNDSDMALKLIMTGD